MTAYDNQGRPATKKGMTRYGNRDDSHGHSALSHCFYYLFVTSNKDISNNK